MEFVEKIKTMLSQGEEFEAVWQWLLQSEAGGFLKEMQAVEQNPEFHGEGSVYTHTKMVCKALCEKEEFLGLAAIEQTELFLAALLHDIGKIRTTVMEDGKWISPHHSSVGSQMARSFLWQTCGLCGSLKAMEFRETVCGLIRWHMLPVHMIDQEDALWRIRQIASAGELAKNFTWKKLCLLADADVRGRIASDIEECREKAALCRVLAEEAGCLEGAFSYSDSFTKHAYLNGRNVQPDQSLYNDTWGEVIMLSGLPGTGKDTWILRHCQELPVISLDGIRKELGVKPSGDQGKVIYEARERAKVLLRGKQPFVWNATNLSAGIRQKQLRLFEQYKASVRIVYLETEERIRRERNASREAVVPEAAVENMLKKTEPPLPVEAQRVEWHCV